MAYVSANKASKYYHVSPQTLKRWADKERLEYKITDGGHRRYFTPVPNVEGETIIYARVSSSKQEGDLKRQVNYLQKLYPTYTVVTDIGSGINFKRKGLLAILDKLFSHNVKEVVVASQDRFTRFGFDLFEFIFERLGAQLTYVNGKQLKSSEEELADDLLAIITVFTARYYGKRKYTLHTKN